MHGRVAGWLATITTIRQPLFRGAWGCGFGKLSAFQQPSVKINGFSAIIGPEAAGRKSTEEKVSAQTPKGIRTALSEAKHTFLERNVLEDKCSEDILRFKA